MRYIGIDPGKSKSNQGGIAWIDPDGYGCVKLPLEVPEIAVVFSKIVTFPCIAAIEKEWAMSTNGSKANFNLGQSYGEIQMACGLLGVSYKLVAAVTWQNFVFGKMESGRDKKKAAALRMSQDMFPQAQLKYKNQSGCADALMIAYWLSRQ